ncbi:EF-hand superfamily Ca2+-modulated protein [Penicillium brevicompactum]|uniref:EF-hand superfamily Ca2+-modulated protein n=1 Tax=Penicillium brevicompactum TaxID=5074 RepID=A0A9W9Q8Q5_PENBR|nr:EF-hand superfamily Ca2+-modulated protein [Penicillium brevicompactum]
MPPKRRGAASSAPAPKRGRASKLAKENNITAEEENEIKEVFHMFSHQNEEFPDEKEGVLPREDVRKALVTGNLYTELWTKSQSNTSNRALGLPPTDSSELAEIISALDPTTSGFVPYSPFVSIAAAKLHSRGEDAISAEVDDAYQLFTRGTNGPITLSHLRRIARDLKEDGVGDDLLKDMILEGNGGAGLSAGVTLEQFHDVMTRAGVF